MCSVPYFFVGVLHGYRMLIPACWPLSIRWCARFPSLGIIQVRRTGLGGQATPTVPPPHTHPRALASSSSPLAVPVATNLVHYLIHGVSSYPSCNKNCALFLFFSFLSLCVSSISLSFFLSPAPLARSQQRQCLHSLSDAVGAHHRGHDQARARVPASHRSTRGRDCATKGTTGRARRYRGIHQEGREGTSASVTVCARPPRGLPPHRPHRIRACIVCL